MKKIVLMTLAAAGLAAAASAQTFTLLANIDLVNATANPANNLHIGTNPTAVDWNGVDLIVGGQNNSAGLTQNVGLTRVTNVWSVNPTLSTAFGQISSAATRGYIDIARKGSSIYASYENGGGSAANGLYQFDGSNAPVSNFLAGGFRASGVAIDSRTGNVGAITVASGNRDFILHDAASVSNRIYGLGGSGGAGYAILPGSDANTNWRDMAIDPTNGDVYYRKQNGVWKSTRSADNNGTLATTIVFSPAIATGDLSGQNLEIAYGLGGVGNFLMFNTRTSGATTQSFASNFRLADIATGNIVTPTWVGFNPATVLGAGYYDYSYDAATQTVAISDFTNKRVYIFGVPTPGTAGVLALAGLAGMRRRRA